MQQRYITPTVPTPLIAFTAYTE